jgi:hypothetical protein
MQVKGGRYLTFKTAVWIDPETENYRATIFPEIDGINLAAWGLTAKDVEPISLEASSIFKLGQLCEERLGAIAKDFPMSKFEPIFLGPLARGIDVRAALTEKLAAIAA